MKWEDGFVSSKLARFTERVVSIAQKTVVGEPSLAVNKGNGRYADWVIIAIHSLQQHLDHPYRRLLDGLHEMPRIVSTPGLEMDELPDFTTVCARKQELEMRLWRVLLRLSAELHDLTNLKRSTQPAWIVSLRAKLRKTDEIHVQGCKNDRAHRL